MLHIQQKLHIGRCRRLPFSWYEIRGPSSRVSGRSLKSDSSHSPGVAEPASLCPGFLACLQLLEVSG
ncbi:unnamed protein product [Nezara viridula]|uniref:Uncharacterized protein n=1 Tax=Nezara viridula TaxID=85310 RepID=A0A9P0DYQ3_NEZVI|nr:unnamed protein product [Nezara viridula]